MKDVMKEMGVVCRNKKIGEQMMNVYRNKFSNVCFVHPRKADKYRKEFLWWNNKVILMKAHLEQLHERLKEVS